MNLSITQCVWNLTKALWYFCLLFILPLKGFLVEFWVGMKLRHTCITYFAKSKTRPQGDASHTLWSRHATVWNFYNVLILNIFCTPFNHESLSFGWMPFIWKYALSLFLSFLFFMLFGIHFFSLMPFGMDIFLFFLLFLA